MRRLDAFLAVTLLGLATACTEDSTSDPTGPMGQGSEAFVGPGEEIRVMTRNLYVGADVDAVIAALASSSPDDDFPALATAINTLRATDYPRRAAAVADEIARARPHAVGLQEVSTIDLTLPPLGVDLHLDFLTVLAAELASRGLPYDVAARVRNFDLTPLPGVRVADDDALLVDRERVTVHGSTARRFAANVGQVAPGVVLERGWVSAAVTIDGRDYVIASTHLESGGFAGLDQLRAAQAAELAGTLAGSPSAIVMGDLNDVPGSLMYQVLTGAGFTDVWAALRPGVVGLTCCHLSDLSDQVAPFDQRIDYVFARGVESVNGQVQGQVTLIGKLPSERVTGPDYPIWPSDHAGLVARLATAAP